MIQGPSAGLLLGIAGVVCGAATLLVMRRFSDQQAIRTAKARVRAHMYELRLFADDPLIALRAQKNLLLWNLRYMRLALLPAAIIAVPALVVLAQLDALYGRRALVRGEAAVVTLQMKAGTGLDSLNPLLTATSTFQVETPPVRIESLGQISWRVRAEDVSDGSLRLALPGEVLERPIHAGPGVRYVSADCPSSAFGWVRHGCSLESSSAESIRIDYPEGSVSIAGLEANWLVWLMLFWFAAMLLLRRRFRVTF